MRTANRPYSLGGEAHSMGGRATVASGPNLRRPVCVDQQRQVLKATRLAPSLSTTCTSPSSTTA